jgi:hypothetical protein
MTRAETQRGRDTVRTTQKLRHTHKNRTHMHTHTHTHTHMHTHTYTQTQTHRHKPGRAVGTSGKVKSEVVCAVESKGIREDASVADVFGSVLVFR